VRCAQKKPQASYFRRTGLHVSLPTDNSPSATLRIGWRRHNHLPKFECPSKQISEWALRSILPAIAHIVNSKPVAIKLQGKAPFRHPIPMKTTSLAHFAFVTPSMGRVDAQPRRAHPNLRTRLAQKPDTPTHSCAERHAKVIGWNAWRNERQRPLSCRCRIVTIVIHDMTRVTSDTSNARLPSSSPFSTHARSNFDFNTCDDSQSTFWLQ